MSSQSQMQIDLEYDYDTMIQQLNHLDGFETASLLSEDRDDLAQLMVALFVENKYHHILTIFPSVKEIAALPPAVRLVSSLTLFKLGRTDAALRELGLAIEAEIDYYERERLINYLIKYFKVLGQSADIELCNKELADNKMIQKHTKSCDPPKITKKQAALYNSVVSVSYVPIHVQAQNFLEASGKLHDFSLGRVCILVQSLVVDSVSSLTQWRRRRKSVPDPTQKIFTAIRYFAPDYLFSPLQTHEKTLKAYMAHEIAFYPELELSLDASSLVQMFSRLNKSHSNKSFSYFAGLIVKQKLIASILSFVKEEYEEAAVNLKWLLCFMLTLEKKVHGCIDKSEFFSSVTKRVTCMYLCRSMMFGNLEFTAVTLENIITTLVKHDDMNLTSEFVSNRLFQYFLSCGIAYEKLSLLNGKKIQVEDEQILRYDQAMMEECLRKYIIASTLKPGDDPTVLEVYDKIMWCLMMHGGIHMQVFWFFSSIRNYFQIFFDHGPLYVDAHDRYRVFHSSSLLQYENSDEMVTKISELFYQVQQDDVSGLWDTNDALLMPCMFEAPRKLYVMDKFHDETSAYYDYNNIKKTSQYGIEPGIRSHIKIPAPVIAKFVHQSKDLIQLWVESYVRYQGEVPELIMEALL